MYRPLNINMYILKILTITRIKKKTPLKIHTRITNKYIKLSVYFIEKQITVNCTSTAPALYTHVVLNQDYGVNITLKRQIQIKVYYTLNHRP